MQLGKSTIPEELLRMRENLWYLMNKVGYNIINIILSLTTI